jgi:hypothetical protein
MNITRISVNFSTRKFWLIVLFFANSYFLKRYLVAIVGDYVVGESWNGRMVRRYMDERKRW